MSKLCYNRGCGKTFDPSNNPEDGCTYHSGAPEFHDAYKSWSCCGRKTTDFSVFLSTPGCVKGRHSNVKVAEPQSITGNLTKEKTPEVEIVVRDPLPKSSLPRPDFNSKLIRLQPTIAASLKQQLANLTAEGSSLISGVMDGIIPEGESCKNGGCKITFNGDNENDKCTYHPGVPVFHEGLKFWSCCQRKTTDFQSFLDQEGCSFGTHKWIKSNEGSADVECRYDWHQTSSTVTVAIYAKKYDPEKSLIEINPIRLKTHIYFPEQAGSFNLDLELKGLIGVEESSCSMLGTKVEIKMKKAEAGSWSKLYIPKVTLTKSKPEEDKIDILNPSSKIESQVDALDLDDLEFTPQKATLSKEASGGKTEAEII